MLYLIQISFDFRRILYYIIGYPRKIALLSYNYPAYIASRISNYFNIPQDFLNNFKKTNSFQFVTKILGLKLIEAFFL